MKISDQGFTERLSSPAARTESTGNSTSGSSIQGNRQGSSDNFQLSSIASRLQSTPSFDAGRAQQLSQIAKAVSSGTFQIDPAKISGALVSEAVQTGR